MTGSALPERHALIAGLLLIASMVLAGAFVWLIVGDSGGAEGGPALSRPKVSGMSLACRSGPVLTIRARTGSARRATVRVTVSRNGDTVTERSKKARPAGRRIVVRIPLGTAADRVLPSCKVPRGVAVTVQVTSTLGPRRKIATRTLRGSALRAVTTRRIELGPVGDPVTEASGLVESRRTPGRFYTHDDSGGPASIYVLSEDGSLRAVLPLAGVSNRDWEDAAIGPGPGGGAIYVGEIGDNSAVHDSVFVHRVPEPALGGIPIGESLTPVEPETVELTYPDGPRDAEALFVDPSGGDLYLITKREDSARVYRAGDPAFGSREASELEFVRELDYAGVVAADICPDGETVLTKTYFGVYAHVSKEGVESALVEPGIPRLYLPDFSFAQDESIAADPWCSGYSVLPEGNGAPLARYVS